jgi:hypothetical protein
MIFAGTLEEKKRCSLYDIFEGASLTTIFARRVTGLEV